MYVFISKQSISERTNEQTNKQQPTMDSTAFKHNKHDYYLQQNQHNNSKSNKNNSNSNSNSSSHNNNQDSIFILNTATNNTLPNSTRLYYSDLNDNNAVPSSASSSVWSSASSTMCSPAAHAIQKLFNCSSNSLKFNHGNYNGIESKSFKSKSEILKKKTKFWKYLEANEQNNPKGIEGADANANASANKKKILAKSFKQKSKYWSKSYEQDNQEDLSELLEYNCSLCDNCRCMDCQIGYFDCDNSDDSNSEYSFEYADESDNEIMTQRTRELRSSGNKPRQLQVDVKSPTDSNTTCSVNDKQQCCQQCFIASIADGEGEMKNQQDFQLITDH